MMTPTGPNVVDAIMALLFLLATLPAPRGGLRACAAAADGAGRAGAFINYSERERAPPVAAAALTEDDVQGVVLESGNSQVRLRLRRDWAPEACRLVAGLALAPDRCSRCTWYRHEPALETWGVNGYYGPPYGLLQGGLPGLASAVAVDNKKALPAKRGRASFIAGTDFFISSVDHSEWGASFTVFAEVLGEPDLQAMEAVPFEPYRNSTDEKWNFTTRWLLEPVPLRISALSSSQLALLGLKGSGSTPASSASASATQTRQADEV